MDNYSFDNGLSQLSASMTVIRQALTSNAVAHKLATLENCASPWAPF